MSLYQLFYPCKCGTRHIKTVDGETEVTEEIKHHICETGGADVKLGDVMQAIYSA